jgi:hypothetical protein
VNTAEIVRLPNEKDCSLPKTVRLTLSDVHEIDPPADVEAIPNRFVTVETLLHQLETEMGDETIRHRCQVSSSGPSARFLRPRTIGRPDMRPYKSRWMNCSTCAAI